MTENYQPAAAENYQPPTAPPQPGTAEVPDASPEPGPGSGADHLPAVGALVRHERTDPLHNTQLTGYGLVVDHTEDGKALVAELTLVPVPFDGDQLTDL